MTINVCDVDEVDVHEFGKSSLGKTIRRIFRAFSGIAVHPFLADFAGPLTISGYHQHSMNNQSMHPATLHIPI